MRNITIGVVSPDWQPAATARYYAQRGGSDDYAFGKTPAEALARLEAREATIDPAFDADLAEEIAFLALGAAEALREHPGANLGAWGGYMGFIKEVTRHAPMLAEYWQRTASDEFCGVWLYDITERFGREWAEGVVAGSDETPVQRLEYIIEDEMEKWS